MKKTVLDDFQDDEPVIESDKKRNNLENKVADAIEKNKFKINKTAEQVKLTPEQTYKLLMTMPIQKIEKISRIEAEIDTEPESLLPSQELGKKPEVEK